LTQRNRNYWVSAEKNGIYRSASTAERGQQAAERMASAPTSFTIPLGVIFKTARFLSNRIGEEMRRDLARLVAKAAIFRCFPGYESVPYLWRATGSILKTAFNKRAYPQR